MKPIIKSELTFEVTDYRVLDVEWRVFLGGSLLITSFHSTITLDHQEIESTESRMGLLPFWYCTHGFGRENDSGLKTITTETSCRYCYLENSGVESESYSFHGKGHMESQDQLQSRSR